MHLLNPNIVILMFLAPLIGALLIVLLQNSKINHVFNISLLAILTSLIGAITILIKCYDKGPIIYFFGGFASPIGIAFHINQLNSLLLILILTIALCTIFFMNKALSLDVRPVNQCKYYALFLLFITGLMGIICTNDIFNLYVFLEITAISAYVLVSMGRSCNALFASFRYLIVGSIGATFILLGIGLLYFATGTLDLDDISLQITNNNSNERLLWGAYLLITFGFIAKIALFPLHGWLIHVYKYCPSALAIFLASCSSKIFLFALYKISFQSLNVVYSNNYFFSLRYLLQVFIALAIIYGGIKAIFSDNLKSLLVYSSIGQIGYLIMGITIKNASVISGSFIAFFSHALAASVLFAIAAILIYLYDSCDLSYLSTLIKKSKIMLFCLLISLFSLMGLPLSLGFISKFYILSGTLYTSQWWMMIAVILGSALSLIYCIKVIYYAYFAGKVTQSDKKIPKTMLVPIYFLTTALLLLGIAPWILLNPIELSINNWF